MPRVCTAAMRLGSTKRSTSRRIPSRVAFAPVAIALLALYGCTGAGKRHVLPEDGPPMLEIYERHFDEMHGGSIEGARAKLGQPVQGRGIRSGNLDLAGYTRTAQTEIEAIFPELPNPTLVMYVFPHLTGGERAPVPGYSTSFRMYEGAEYALPGEALAR
jgi:conjugative transfer region lipoprotein (TIGR03751 family)